MESLTVECDNIRVRARAMPAAAITIPPALATVGTVSIIGILLIVIVETSAIPIATDTSKSATIKL